MVHGASDADLREYGLKNSDSNRFHYLNQGGPNISNKADDQKNFRLVNDAMRIANFEPELIKTIWQMVSAVILLGNVKLEENDKDINNNDGGSTRISSDSMENVKSIAKLLKVNENDLKTALTSRLLATGRGKDVLTTYHSATEASYAKDAFAKVHPQNTIFRL